MAINSKIRKGRVRPVNNFVEFLFFVPKTDKRDKIRLVFKIFVLLSLLAGCFYQVSSFLQLYFKYPSAMDFDIAYPEFIEAPAISICNINGLRRVPWCLHKPGQCIMSTRGEEVCEADPVLCQNKTHMANYMVPMLEYLEAEIPFNTSRDLDAFGHRAENLFNSCYVSWAKEVNICGAQNVQRAVLYGAFEVLRNCYIVNSRLQQEPTKASYIPLEERDDGNYIKIILDLEPFEYFQPKRAVEAIIDIHGAIQKPNIYTTGFTIRPGKTYTIYVTPKVTHLLKAPFPSNCTDYHAKWLAANKTGVRTQLQCVEKCIVRIAREKCNCFALVGMHLRTEIKDNEQICLRSDECFRNINITECSLNCAKDCLLATFEYKFFDSAFENVPENKMFDEEFGVHNIGVDKEDQDMYFVPLNKSMTSYSPMFSKDRYIQLTIKLHKPQMNVYKEKAKFERIEVFGYLGAYVGLWLGMSLLSISDLEDGIAFLCKSAKKKPKGDDVK